MKAGILKEQIQILQPIIQKTESGVNKTSWEPYYTTRASVQHNGGSRGTENNELFYSINKTFIVRHYVPVVEKMRIKYEGKNYKIISIIPNKYYNDKEINTELVNE
jgi:SPP1 family predicted phage head-tail adaptor